MKKDDNLFSGSLAKELGLKRKENVFEREQDKTQSSHWHNVNSDWTSDEPSGN
jgi:hypothetical protein